MEITVADIRAFGNDERDVAKVRRCHEYLETLLPPAETIRSFFISRHGGYSEDLFFFTDSFMIRFPEFQKAIARGATECSLYSLNCSLIGLDLDAQEVTEFLSRSLSVEITMKDLENIRMNAVGAACDRLELIVRESLIPHLRR